MKPQNNNDNVVCGDPPKEKPQNNNDNVVCESTPAESFREFIERRLEALEAGGTTSQDTADIRRRVEVLEGISGQDSNAGLIRTLGERATQLETTTGENVGAILRLTDIVKAQADTIKTQGEAIAALQAKLNG